MEECRGGPAFRRRRGGICFDPKSFSAEELERITRRYASEMNIIMGPEKDIPEPDESTDERVMAWIMDTYSDGCRLLRFRGL